MTNWPVKNLGDICRIEMGRTPSRGDSSGWDKEFKTSNHWASIADLTACSGSLLTSTKERISDFAAKTTKVVPAGTLMMSFKLSIGKLAFAGCDLYTNEAIAAFHLPENADVDSAFLYWALSVIDWSALTKGSEKVKGATMNKAKLNLLKIPLPSLGEQKRIVELLDAATARVTELSACYERARTQANNLFTSALREALESNPDWPVKTLGEVCELVNGATPDTKVKEYWGGKHAWITPAEMGGLDSPFLSVSRRTLSDKGLASCSATMVPPKTVILSSRAPIGHLVINEVPMATNQGCKSLIPKEGLDFSFLYYYLKANVEILESLGTGTTFKELSGTQLKTVEIPVPPLEEQQRIVARLDSMKAKTSEMFAAYDAKLSAAKNLRQSILEAAFAGQL